MPLVFHTIKDWYSGQGNNICQDYYILQIYKSTFCGMLFTMLPNSTNFLMLPSYAASLMKSFFAFTKFFY